MESLGIDGNDALGALPESFGQLGSLKSLVISQNAQIQTFPAVEIQELPQLTRLEVRGDIKSYDQSVYLPPDSITTIPSFIGQLTQLDTLNLSALLLEDLPAELENLRGNLKYLDISYNPMLDEWWKNGGGGCRRRRWCFCGLGSRVGVGVFFTTQGT